MKEINTVKIRVYHRCDRCGQEAKNPKVIQCMIDPSVTYDEELERVTIEALYTKENDPFAPDEDGEMVIVEKR